MHYISVYSSRGKQRKLKPHWNWHSHSDLMERLRCCWMSDMLVLICVSLLLLTSTHGAVNEAKKSKKLLEYPKVQPCLNGAISVSAPNTGEHIYCLCPEGFSGSSCEIDDSAVCYVGNGLNYRGPASQTGSLRKCLEWDTINNHAFGSDSRTLGLGRHNRCRNPDNSRKPWCFVQGLFRIVKEYCDIPYCPREPALSNPVPPLLKDSDWHCGHPIGSQLKIVGGSLSTVEHHPWMAAVFWKTRRQSSGQHRVFHCGGSLIAPCWVLTAAHCFPDGANTNLRKLQVVLGKNALNETDPRTEQVFSVTQLFVHEHFDNNDDSYNDDIALLQINSPEGVCAVETSSVRTVCLPPPHLSLPDRTSCKISGYGKEHQGLWYNSQYLREGTVNLLPQDVCSSENYYGNTITDNMLCAGASDWSVDACKGDSGGPLVCEVDGRSFLFGLVSWGEGCSREFRPGVYTRVVKYHHWILQKTNLVPLQLPTPAGVTNSLHEQD